MTKKKTVMGFKKFSDIKKDKNKVEEYSPEVVNIGNDEDKRPMNPNLHKKSSKVEKPASTKNMKPEKDVEKNSDDESVDEKKVQQIGKVAKFPKNTRASKAYNFLENVKVSKKSIWYIIVEKQDNELQMVKYNYKEGVNLSSFVNELKTYYMNKYKKNQKICKLIENIYVDGNDKYSMVKNIPLVEVEGVKMVTKITSDLISLLSK